MGLMENVKEIEETVYECLVANGIAIERGNVYFDYDDFKIYKVKAEANDGTRFDFPISQSFVSSLDGKYKFDIQPFKKPVKTFLQ